MQRLVFCWHRVCVGKFPDVEFSKTENLKYSLEAFCCDGSRERTLFEAQVSISDSNAFAWWVAMIGFGWKSVIGNYCQVELELALPTSQHDVMETINGPLRIIRPYLDREEAEEIFRRANHLNSIRA